MRTVHRWFLLRPGRALNDVVTGVIGRAQRKYCMRIHALVVQDWPGVHCAQALLDGTALDGTWFDRTTAYQAHRKGKEKAPADFAQAEKVVFTPIPCWAAQGPALYRQRIATLVDSIVADACRERDGQGVLGRRAILAQHPYEKPLDCDHSPAPAVHAATKAIHLMLRAQYRQLAAAFRQAAHLLRRGDRLARFPLGAFPPPMPCVVSTA